MPAMIFPSGSDCDPDPGNDADSGRCLPPVLPACNTFAPAIQTMKKT
jgi:hypothetical protein